MYKDGFPCTGCSGCCRLIGGILDKGQNHPDPVLRQVIASFPYVTDENGVCEKLIDNRCSVYDNRPLLCNVTLLGKLLSLDLNEWYSKNIKHCNLIIDFLGLDKSYKIPEVS